MIRIKNFDQNFKTKLYEKVSLIESKSGTEAVVIIKNSSGNYFSRVLAASGIFFILLLSYFMLSPIEYDPYSMYIISLLSSVAVFCILYFIPGLQFFLISEKTKKKNTEIHARALFQKAQMYKTQNHIAFLVYFSLLEKKSYFLTDYGINLIMDDDEIKNISEKLQKALKGKNPKDDILKALDEIATVMEKYIPRPEDDINELPDDLDVEL
ncbi:MAG: TPM domain-containing protein [Bacteroidales bacterium]|jgi:uncharacterized membrane protein|nr:TPM domain-containing protein [Bacteroidales bacterium]MBR6277136.1 TPM domain-containing protein [Bacteroidales bacterium]